MIKLTTPVFIPESNKKINHQTNVMFMGSCFTENIGQYLKKFKFNVDINPFGILYNPISVSSGINILKEKVSFTGTDLHFNNDLFHSFYHHGDFSDISPQVALEKINSRIEDSSAFLNNADFLFITLGTSFVYKHKKLKKVVSNCHKFSADIFERYILSIDEIVEELTQMLEQIRLNNSNINVVFTVSPVRHWKDGAVNNQLSKSQLLCAIHQLKQQFSFVDYFPAYEIMMDELRDYRFYADDMLHPNKLAVEIIWEKFSDCYICSQSTAAFSDIEKLNKAMHHRIQNPKLPQSIEFIKKQINKIGLLRRKYRDINFDEELKYFRNLL